MYNTNYTKLEMEQLFIFVQIGKLLPELKQCIVDVFFTIPIEVDILINLADKKEWSLLNTIIKSNHIIFYNYHYDTQVWFCRSDLDYDSEWKYSHDMFMAILLANRRFVRGMNTIFHNRELLEDTIEYMIKLLSVDGVREAFYHAMKNQYDIQVTREHIKKNLRILRKKISHETWIKLLEYDDRVYWVEKALEKYSIY